MTENGGDLWPLREEEGPSDLTLQDVSMVS